MGLNVKIGSFTDVKIVSMFDGDSLEFLVLLIVGMCILQIKLIGLIVCLYPAIKMQDMATKSGHGLYLFTDPSTS